MEPTILSYCLAYKSYSKRMCRLSAYFYETELAVRLLQPFMQSSMFSVLRSMELFSTGNVLASKTTLEVTRVYLANENMARLSIFISVWKFPWKWKLCLTALTEDLLKGPCMDHRQSPNQQLAIHCHTALHIIMMV